MANKIYLIPKPETLRAELEKGKLTDKQAYAIISSFGRASKNNVGLAQQRSDEYRESLKDEELETLVKKASGYAKQKNENQGVIGDAIVLLGIKGDVQAYGGHADLREGVPAITITALKNIAKNGRGEEAYRVVQQLIDVVEKKKPGKQNLIDDIYQHISPEERGKLVDEAVNFAVKQKIEGSKEFAIDAIQLLEAAGHVGKKVTYDYVHKKH